VSSDAFKFRYQMRTLTDTLVTTLAILATLIVIAPLVAIFRLPALHGHQLAESGLLTKIPVPVGEQAAAWPTQSSAPAFCSRSPVSSAFHRHRRRLFLAEFGREHRRNAVRFTADVLNGVPSIVMGLAAYALIVVPKIPFLPFTGHFSAFSEAWRSAS